MNNFQSRFAQVPVLSSFLTRLHSSDFLVVKSNQGMWEEVVSATLRPPLCGLSPIHLAGIVITHVNLVASK